jgi:hypothetical protein
VSSRLPDDRLEPLLPALGALGRMAARGREPSGADLGVVAAGLDAAPDAAALAELARWSALLAEVHRDPSPGRRDAAMEALMLRGVPEAAALLAVEAASRGAAPGVAEHRPPAGQATGGPGREDGPGRLTPTPLGPPSICPNCGAARPRDALFCGACGVGFNTLTTAHLVEDESEPVWAVLSVAPAASVGEAAALASHNPDLSSELGAPAGTAPVPRPHVRFARETGPASPHRGLYLAAAVTSVAIVVSLALVVSAVYVPPMSVVGAPTPSDTSGVSTAQALASSTVGSSTAPTLVGSIAPDAGSPAASLAPSPSVLTHQTATPSVISGHTPAPSVRPTTSVPATPPPTQKASSAPSPTVTPTQIVSPTPIATPTPTAAPTTTVYAFSGDTAGQAPSGWLLRGTTGMSPSIADVGGSDGLALSFPEVPWQYWDKWALKSGLTVSGPFTVTAKMQWQTAVADRAGITIGWKDATWDRIDIQPNIYARDIEFRSTGITGAVTASGSALTGGGLNIAVNTPYWMRVKGQILANGDGELTVYWSTNGSTFTKVLQAVGPGLGGDAMTGLIGVGTAGPHMPQVWFDNITVTH